jgi:hypothetical protein
MYPQNYAYPTLKTVDPDNVGSSTSHSLTGLYGLSRVLLHFCAFTFYQKIKNIIIHCPKNFIFVLLLFLL